MLTLVELMGKTKGLKPIKTGFRNNITYTFYEKENKIALIGLKLIINKNIKDKKEYIRSKIKELDNNFFNNYDIKRINVIDSDGKKVVILEIENVKSKPKLKFGKVNSTKFKFKQKS